MTGRARALLAAVVAGAFVAGALVQAARTPARPESVTAHRSAAPSEGDEATSRSARSAEGARAAALSYATGPQRWLYMTDAEVEAALVDLTTPAIRRSVIDDVLGELALARDALAASPGRVWWFVAPLATRVDAFSEGAARVTVWTVAVISAEDVAVPQADWETQTFDLEWREGDWKLAGMAEALGPTPALVTRDDPWDARSFDEALAGFERVGEEQAR